MHRFTSTIRQPVKRQGAEQYILITLLSFAASVIFTRLLLELTGYPQLGGGELHIAHVLWGGLLLFISAVLPLIYANRWVYTLGSILAGAGVGLFIDEVGKFITQNNDYFYPLAAPIIYAFFLLTVMLYLRVKRPPHRESRVELYRAIDALEEVLEHDLDPQEREELEARLKYVADQTDKPDLARLANDLLNFLSCDELTLADRRPSFIQRQLERGRELEAKYLNRYKLRAALAGGLFALGLVALANMSMNLPIGDRTASLERVLLRLIEEGQVTSVRGLSWFSARLALETSVGLLLLVAAGLLLAGKDRLGIAFGYLSLLLSLTAINLLVFYFDQFSAIVTATIQFILLMGVTYYRQRYLSESHLQISEPGVTTEEQVTK